jgi:ADP-ribose pyrophosphatase YjhB (NUDIX family)
MAKVIEGHRIGKQGQLAIGCSAAVFDKARQHILLIHRIDNGRWAVPGGYMEAGETIKEACEREVIEETGLRVKVKRLISIYTNPHSLLEYPNGNRIQLVVLHFEAEIISGELHISDESSEVKYFSRKEIENVEIGPLDKIRIIDSFLGESSAIIRDEY